ncbi:probable polyamine oxidase 5 [Impatiens glandulifera]|uniref:probable polyamine oxidase 5 n=1 Tax=Impatiens glandulifera TaxID=253017 RepID=UPI001FB070EF|nr:probable polyamine oxidase 5 [Impatiens glandulifera]
MVNKKPRIVIIGAGMAGLTAANKLYTSPGFNDVLEVIVVEGGNRIGGRINTSEFCGDQIEMGATWIHGIKGSPVHKIAQEINSLHSNRPWECMDGTTSDPLTVAEDGYVLNQTLVNSITSLFNTLMDFAQAKDSEEKNTTIIPLLKPAASVGSFLRKGLESYFDLQKEEEEDLNGYGNWTRKSLEEAVFGMHECIQRTYTSADDLERLDFDAESEYRMFPGEEITIAKGYSSIIHSIASVLPPGSIQLGKRVTKIEWQKQNHNNNHNINDEPNGLPVKLHFLDGSVMMADHVIVTVSLGVLKAAASSTLFDPPLPNFKTQAISRLGFGVVNKLFLQIQEQPNSNKFPFLQMAFHPPDSKLRNQTIPWWIRKTDSLSPIYGKSSVLISWFAGKEAMELESLEDEEIKDGFEKTISSLKVMSTKEIKFSKVLKSKWGSDPLFLGSYSYVEVGSSGDDLDSLAVPLPVCNNNNNNNLSRPLQILFAGEATHRTHYSTTHGAYFSGLREANRLLKHYHLIGGL